MRLGRFVRRRSGRPLAAGSRGGFTLVELMIASILMVVAVLASLSTQVTTHKLVIASQETRTAVTDLQAAMERILLLPPESIPIAGSEFEEGLAIAAFQGLHLRDEAIVADYPDYAPGGAVPDPLQIDLQISWTDFEGRPRTLQLTSVKTK